MLSISSQTSSEEETGWVWKRGRWTGLWKKRYFVLKGAILDYYEADKKSNPKPKGSRKGSFDLGTWKFEKCTQTTKARPFMIRMVSGKQSFLLATNSEQDLTKWISMTSNAYYRSRYGSCIPKVIKCQALARGWKVRRELLKLKRAVVLLQTIRRMYIARSKLATMRVQLVKVQAMARRWLARRDYKAIIRRKRIAAELLSTERIYVTNLQLVIELYFHPLLAVAQSPSYIPAQDVMLIFGNLIQLHLVNAQFLEAIEKKLQNWNMNTKIGHLFSEHTDQMMMVYVPYILNYSEALECVEKNKKKAPFKELLDLNFMDPRGKGLDLSSFLIQPVQRLPRYELLLKDLIKNTEHTHGDYQDLCDGMQRVVKVTTHINEKKREKESVNQVAKLKSQLVGSLAEQIEWQIHHRVVREGEVTFPAEQKINYIILVNDFLLLTQKQKTSYYIRAIVQLQGVAFSSNTDEEQNIENVIIATPSDEQICFTVPLSSKPWSADMLKVVEQIQSRGSPRLNNTPSSCRILKSSSSVIIAPKKALSKFGSLMNLQKT